MERGSVRDEARRESALSLVRSVAANTLWGTAGRIVGGFFALITLSLTRRALGGEGFGGYSTVLAFFYLFNAVADVGLYNILLRDLGFAGRDPGRLLGTALSIRLVSLLASLGIGFAIFLAIPKYGTLNRVAPLAILSYTALSLGQLFVAVLQKHLAVSRAAFAEMASRCFQLLATAALFLYGTRSVGTFLSILGVASVLQLLFLIVAARRYVVIRFRTSWGEVRAMLNDAIPVAISLLFTLVYFRIDAVLLSLLRDLRDAGVYNLAYKILEQLIFLPAMFIGVLTPVLASAFERDRQRFQEIFSRANSIIAMMALPLLVGGWVLAEPLTSFFGDNAAAAPLRPLLIATALIYVGTVLGSVVIVAGRQRRAIPVYAAATAVNLFGNIAFIPKYSFHAASWMTVVTEALVDIGLIAVLRNAAIAFSVPRFLRILSATAVMALPLLLFAKSAIASWGTFSLIPFLIGCPILYGVSLIAFRAISRDDLKLLRRIHHTEPQEEHERS